ncbi:hypothetical protein M3Y97_00960600 [Aphelenchoides bicaudatus]|nr:hypothetical protein M3Y97_00960600 [Aphelenchoides bicaudatus]
MYQQQETAVYYPKLDGLSEGLDNLQSGVESMSAGTCVFNIVQGSVVVQTTSQVETSAEVEHRCRVLFFNWTEQALQSVARIAAWLGIIFCSIFIAIGQFAENLDPVIWRYSLTYVPILHAFSCLVLLLGIRYKKSCFYNIYLFLNIMVFIFSFLFAVLLFMNAKRYQLPEVYVFFAVMHLLLCIPLFFALLVIRNAKFWMEAKPRVNSTVAVASLTDVNL